MVGLNDDEIENRVNDCLSFSRFAGIGMEEPVPDSMTLLGWQRHTHCTSWRQLPKTYTVCLGLLSPIV